APFTRTGAPVMVMDCASAELCKYAANALLATKISFMNEIANVCELFGADVDEVRRAIGSDRRVGPSFLFPGVGFGGSCFLTDAKLQAFDPEAMKVAKGLFGSRVTLVDKGYDALKGADALAIVTEWSEFREPDFARMRKLLKSPVIFDGRNIYSPELMREHGF